MTHTKFYPNGTIGFEGAELRFRNFEGREGDYNKEGDRSFIVLLKPSDAEKLEKDGWNVKWPKQRDEDSDEADTRNPHIMVSVAFNKFPAMLHLIKVENGQVVNSKTLGPDEVAMLDWTELANVDLVVRPYEWTVRGNSGKKAYLKVGYFTPIVDEFAAKYGL